MDHDKTKPAYFTACGLEFNAVWRSHLWQVNYNGVVFKAPTPEGVAENLNTFMKRHRELYDAAMQAASMKQANIIIRAKRPKGDPLGHGVLSGRDVEVFIRTDDGEEHLLKCSSLQINVERTGLIKVKAMLLPHEIHIDGIVEIETTKSDDS